MPRPSILLALTLSLLAPAWVEAAPFVEPDVVVVHRTASESPGDGYGWAAERIGDLDGDGAADYAISAPRNPTGGFRAGKVYVQSGATGAVLATHVGDPFRRLGFGVTGGGDLDADGTPDYVLGGPAIMGGAGLVRAHSGRTHAELWTFSGVPRDLLGFDVGIAGDVDRDGHDDVIAGAPNATAAGLPGAGRVFVLSGRDGSILWSRDGTQAFGSLGTGVSGLRDLDGDGVPEQASGAAGDVRAGHGKPQFRGGLAYVHDGATGRVLSTLKPSGTAFSFGLFFVHDAGDVDADGTGDVLVGDVTDLRQAIAGRAYVYSGATGQRLRTINGDDAGEGLGIGRGAGDLDGDGHDDLLLGAWLNSTAGFQAGQALLVSGRNGRTLRTFTATGVLEQIGFDTVPLGDVTADGLPDFLLTGNDVAYVVQGTPLPRSSEDALEDEDDVPYDGHPVHVDLVGEQRDELGDRSLR